MKISKILVEMFDFLHLLLSSLRPISQLAVILSIHITDVNHSIGVQLELSSQFGVQFGVAFNLLPL